MRPNKTGVEKYGIAHWPDAKRSELADEISQDPQTESNLMDCMRQLPAEILAKINQSDLEERFYSAANLYAQYYLMLELYQLPRSSPIRLREGPEVQDALVEKGETLLELMDAQVASQFMRNLRNVVETAISAKVGKILG